MTISILIPVYKGAQTLTDTLESIINQTKLPDEVIIGDDTPFSDMGETQKIKKIIHKFIKKASFKVVFTKNKTNLGCQKNFQKLTDTATNDIVLYLAHDDIFSKNAVSVVRKVFQDNPNIGFMTRPYFWFYDSTHKPIRHVPPPNINQHTIIPSANDLINGIASSSQSNTIINSDDVVKMIFGSIGQISGLALRRKWVKKPFHEDIFPGHMYPIADMWKIHQGIFIKNYIVAIGTETSQSRTLTGIYDDSPTEQWMRMFRTNFGDSKYNTILKYCTKHITTNYIGLIQIKNYSSVTNVFREIYILIKYRKKNLLEPQFWLYSILSALIPKVILRYITDWYKQTILSQTVPQILFKYKK